MELDDLIGLNAFGFGGLLRIETPEVEISFGEDDEKGSGLMNLVEAGKIQIASVEEVNGSGFYEEFVEKLDLVDFAMSDEDQRRMLPRKSINVWSLIAPLRWRK